MEKFLGPAIILLLGVGSHAATLEDVQRIEAMTAVSQNVQRAEPMTHEKPADSLEIRKLRFSLKRSIDRYYSAVKTMQAKYEPWAQSVRKIHELQAATANNFKERVWNYLSVKYYEFKARFQAPRGARNPEAQESDATNLEVHEMIIDQSANQLLFAVQVAKVSGKSRAPASVKRHAAHSGGKHKAKNAIANGLMKKTTKR